MRNALVLLGICFALLLNAQSIDFFHGNYKDAFAAAQAKDQLVFVDAYAVWCGPCKKMSKQVFTQAEIGNYFNENFINLKIDMEKGQGIEFGNKYPVSAYPTFFFINGSGEVIYKFKGYRDAKGLISEADKALALFDNSAKYEALYKEGKRDYKTVFSYIKALNKKGESSLKISNSYLRSNPNISEKEYADFLFEATTELDSKPFELLIKKRKQVLQYYSKEKLNDKILSSAESTYEKALEFESGDLEQLVFKNVKKYAKKSYKVFVLEMKMKKAFQQNDSKLYVENAAQLYKRIDKSEEKAKMNLAKDLLKRFGSQSEALHLSTKIATDIAESHKSAKNYLFVCHNYTLQKKYNEARKWAEKAKEIAGEVSREKYQALEQLKLLEGK